MEKFDDSEHTTEPLAESELVDSAAWAMVESSPDGMLLADDHGQILLVNSQVEELFGYARSELLGQSVEVLLPERFRKVHTAHRTRYRVDPKPRAMGGDLLLRARRKDKTEFPVEVSLSPLHTACETRVVATIRDVTERYESEAEMHAVLHTVNAARDGFFMFDPDSLAFTYVNEGAIRQLGYTRAELLSMSPLHIKPLFDEETFRTLMQPLLDGVVSSHVFTTTHRRKSGEDVPVEIILEYPQPVDVGRKRRLVAIVRDISDRVKADLALASSEDAFRTAFDSAPVGMALVDFTDPVRRPITRVNQALCDFLGYTEQELLTKGFAELTHPDDAPVSDQKAIQTANGEIARFATEKRYLHANGQVIWAWVHSAVLDNGLDTPVSVLVHVADLTEARRVRQDEARLRVLEDRERLAEDLHDLIIQRLFAAGMGLQSLQTRVSDPIASERLAQTVDELDHTIADLRNTIFRLHSPIKSSTRHDIEESVHNAQRSLGFSPELLIEGDPDQIAGSVAEQMLPVIIEALMNIAKHAAASQATVSIVIGDQVELTISDDGCGFITQQSGGHGLKNMRVRAERVGGTFALHSPPDGGAQLVWTAANR